MVVVERVVLRQLDLVHERQVGVGVETVHAAAMTTCQGREGVFLKSQFVEMGICIGIGIGIGIRIGIGIGIGI